jgi:hypothetical protein
MSSGFGTDGLGRPPAEPIASGLAVGEHSP